MSSAEFSEWVEFYKLEPFGRDAEFQGHALNAAMLYNVNRGADTEPVTTEDFMPHEPPEPQSPDQMKQFAQMMAMGGLGTFEEK